jgi:threonine dehydrogenase-like Zn-dependent dehydrogenase
MKAAVLTAPRRIELMQQELPALQRDQALVRIVQCGVCMGEVDQWRGKAPGELPAAIGHEVAGVVEELGEGVTTLQVGDRVAAWVPEGGFAEKAVVAERFCIPAAPTVRYPAVAEPLSCVINAVELAAPALGDDIAIIGAGFMGSLVQLVTALKGPRKIIVCDARPDALSRAAGLGGTTIATAGPDSLADIIGQLTSERGTDVTYEVTGTGEGLLLAGQVTRMGGKLCIVGYHQGGTRTIPLGEWNWKAFHIVNAHFRDTGTIMTGMRAGMRLVNAKVVDPSPLVTHTYPISRISEAFDVAGTRPDAFVKAVIEPNK